MTTLPRILATVSLALLPVVGPAGSAAASPALSAPAATGSTVAATSTSRVTDVAHRGSSGSAPENTIAAVRLALAQGASFVEVDVQRTSDGSLVVLHDTTLTRTTDVEQVFPGRSPWEVGDFTLAQVRRLDAGSWHSARYAGAKVPTLREVIGAVGSRAGLLLELKAPGRYPGIERRVARALAAPRGYLSRARAGNRLVVQSFDQESMRTFHRLQPRTPTGLLVGYRPSRSQIAAASRWADQVNPSFRVTDRGLVRAIHRHGMSVQVWTLDSESAMREALDAGVDGIITNHPDRLRAVLGR